MPSSRRLPQLSPSQTKTWQSLEHAGGSGECWTELMGKSHLILAAFPNMMNFPIAAPTDWKALPAES